MSAVSQYLIEVQKILQTGDAREHAYRPAFQRLIESLTSDIQVINEPAYTGGNAPDFLFKRGNVPISYAECKDVTVDITDKEVVKQANRYVAAFGKILLTNYFDFQILDENGEVAKISIASKSGNTISPIDANFQQFENLVKDYITPSSRTIRSAKKLAEIMASKARLLRDNSLAAIRENKDSEIYAQYTAFREVLIRDLTEEEFVDMYAQTLVYGLFVARYFDESLSNFTRHEAHDLLPSTNPLLKKFFGHVAGTDFDPKIAWMVDSLVEAYKSTDVKELMHKEFEKKQKDPVLHFYETFLSEYDQSLRKARGVYYTPEPVVSFIVRSVDQILKAKFDLPKGLADTSKVEHEFRVQGGDGRTRDGGKKIKEQIHKVQILDPAVGTGTFLNEVIHEIYKTFEGQEGRWNGYVEKELLPRLHGFELMMASYTMAHLKLGVTLKELGYKGMTERLSVWLTNSLEESVHEVPNLFMSQWLTQESNEASRIKSEMPIMVITGNPPYAVSSMNPSKDHNGKPTQIGILIEDYKKDLNEKKINLDDDYIKFIRFAENSIQKTGYGIVAMITNNSFISGLTHRQMRKHLLETFDEIYVLDLHGDSKRDKGSKEENVFNTIQQGVSINLFIKNTSKNQVGRIFHADLFGSRINKFEALKSVDFSSVDWNEIKVAEPYYFFVPKNIDHSDEYSNGFSIKELFLQRSTGIETQNDDVLIASDKNQLMDKIKSELVNEKSKLFNRINADELSSEKIYKMAHKVFDFRYTYLDGRLLGRARLPFMNSMLEGNIALLSSRQFTVKEKPGVFVCDSLAAHKSFSANDKTILFPLYFLAEDGEKTVNLKKDICDLFESVVGKTAPEDIFDYIYAVMHSPDYLSKYRHFLEMDFPRVPYPTNNNQFWKLVEIGRKLRGLHLLTTSDVNKFITTFPIDGDNKVEGKFPEIKDGNVYINSQQYFGNVPKEVWEFYIGGYQPSQKWLKDRRERVLTDEEIDHYQKMIVSMSNTIKLMEDIDKHMPA